jgi:copper(I)-binding protein
LSVGTVHIVLTNLTAPIKPGLTYPVTLVFANAGAITLR